MIHLFILQAGTLILLAISAVSGSYQGVWVFYVCFFVATLMMIVVAEIKKELRK